LVILPSFLESLMNRASLKNALRYVLMTAPQKMRTVVKLYGTWNTAKIRHIGVAAFLQYVDDRAPKAEAGRKVQGARITTKKRHQGAAAYIPKYSIVRAPNGEDGRKERRPWITAKIRHKGGAASFSQCKLCKSRSQR
jgi:hypothetical protein